MSAIRMNTVEGGSVSRSKARGRRCNFGDSHANITASLVLM
jgi:hypothetical protein